MEPQVKHKFTVKGGKRNYLKPTQQAAAMAAMEGKGVFYEVYEPEFEPTTTDQHGYYRGGIIRTVCMQTELFGGWKEDDIHEYFASEFLSNKRMKRLNNWDIEITKVESTANLGKRKMAEFITKVIDWLAQTGIEVPPPEDFILKKYSSKERTLNEENQ